MTFSPLDAQSAKNADVRGGEQRLSVDWGARARALLQEALDLAEGGDDAIITVSAALACLRIEMGELSESELEGYPFPGEEPDLGDCICPPDLLARGGFKGGCRVHSLVHG